MKKLFLLVVLILGVTATQAQALEESVTFKKLVLGHDTVAHEINVTIKFDEADGVSLTTAQDTIKYSYEYFTFMEIKDSGEVLHVRLKEISKPEAVYLFAYAPSLGATDFTTANADTTFYLLK